MTLAGAIAGFVALQYREGRAVAVNVPADALVRVDADDLVTEQAGPQPRRLCTAQRFGPAPKLKPPAHAGPERPWPVRNRVIDHERYAEPRRDVADLPARSPSLGPPISMVPSELSR